MVNITQTPLAGLGKAVHWILILSLTMITACGSDSSDESEVIQPTPSQKEYTLTISISGDGKTEPPSGTHTYTAGETVIITATPSNGSTFTGWRGTESGTENPLTVTMESNLTLTANFAGDFPTPLPDQCSSTCDDATPVYSTPFTDGGMGNVTMYSTEASNGGACNLGSTNIMYYAAIYSNIEPNDGTGRYQAGRACGRCAEVTVLTSQGLRSVVVRIVDECPDTYCGIDLGGAAPGDLMIDGFGRYEGQWRFVSCDGHPGVSDGPPSLDVFRDSNPYWSRVFVRNGPTAVQIMEWKTADGSKSGELPYAQSPENTYEVPVNEVLQSQTSSSFLITVRYIDGTTATVTLSQNELSTPGSYPLN